MNNLNSVLIEGNMVRDPILRSTPKGSAVCSFSIATNRYIRHDGNFDHEVSYFDVECWGKLAQEVHDHGGKGSGMRVVGRLKQDRWIGSDEKNHSRVAIVAEHVEFHNDPRKTHVTPESPPAEAARESGVRQEAEAAF